MGRITTPWNYQFDVKLEKTIKTRSLAFTAYVYVQNIFNRKNVQNVYLTTGDTNDDGSFPVDSWQRRYNDERFFRLYDLINKGHRQHYQIVNGGDLFGRPREIRFGVRIGFGADE